MSDMPSKVTLRQFLILVKGLDLEGLVAVIRGRALDTLDFPSLLTLLSQGKSLVRWGDGETANLRNKSTWLQPKDTNLAKDLEELLDFAITSKELIFCAPHDALQHSIFSSKEWNQEKLKTLLTSRILFNLPRYRSLIERKSATSTLWYSNFDKLPELLNVIKITEKDVFFVSNRDSKLLKSKARSYKLHLIPSRAAYLTKGEIEGSFEKWISDVRTPIVIHSGGPTLKALSPKIMQHCQTIDIGHGMLFHATGKQLMEWDVNRE